MKFRDWFLLLIPLVMVVSFFTFFSGAKSPESILNKAQTSLDDLTAYVVKSDVVMDFDMMGMGMHYFYNVTNAVRDNESYSKVVTTIPFSQELMVMEDFQLMNGSFSCTDDFGGVCFLESNNMPFEEPVKGDYYSSIEYLGSKKVNGVSCDALYFQVNQSLMDSFINDSLSSGLTDGFGSINELYFYSCIDPDTGLSLESIWGVSGESVIEGINVDLSINITKILNNFSEEVPESYFKLPYDIISVEEYESLINQTYGNLTL